MKYFLTLVTLCVALLITAACGTATNTNTNTNTAGPAHSPTAAPASSPATANPGAAQDFTLVNKTGVEIDKVFISPHDADDWEEDILGRDTLPNGESVDIKFHRNETAALWDMRIEDKEGNGIEWENLNLLQISKATLHYANGKATAEVE